MSDLDFKSNKSYSKGMRAIDYVILGYIASGYYESSLVRLELGITQQRLSASLVKLKRRDLIINTSEGWRLIC